MKKPIKCCSECGARRVEYKHSLSPILLEGLKALEARGGGPTNLRDLNLERTVWDNFQKLRYFGLVEKADPGNPKGGEWRITSYGRSFLRGETTCPKSVWTYRGKVTDWAEGEIFVGAVKGRTKTRADYNLDARGVDIGPL